MKNSYQIISKDIISENLESETIVINLLTGIYYSINYTGSVIWSAIQEQYQITEIILAFSSKFPNSQSITSDVRDFVDLLLSEQLIVEVDETISNKNLSINFNQENYIKPSFDKYEDMQEMLLADPIHEVEKDGWPNVKRK